MASLENVKVGDEILIWHGAGNEEVRRVARTTNTRVEDERGGRWRRSDGGLVGRSGRSTGMTPTARLSTQTARDRIRRRELTWRACGVVRADLENATLGQLEAVVAAIDACKGEGGE